MWSPDQCPLEDEAIPGELEIGDAMIFVGNVYHAGGPNTTKYDPYLFPKEDVDEASRYEA